MNKKITELLLTIAMITLLLAGCGQAVQTPADSSTPTGSSEPSQSEEPTTPQESETPNVEIYLFRGIAPILTYWQRHLTQSSNLCYTYVVSSYQLRTT